MGQGMAADILVLGILPVLLTVAAAYDMVKFTIPGDLLVALLLGFAVFAVVTGLGGAAIGAHLLAGGLGFGLGLGLFAFDIVGGGDAKLLGAAALWLGLHDLPAYMMCAGLLGCLLTLGLNGVRRAALPHFLVHPWILRLTDPDTGIPYGMALAGGLFAVLPHAEILRLAFAPGSAAG
jgi:prepilin peptidase CpaA